MWPHGAVGSDSLAGLGHLRNRRPHGRCAGEREGFGFHYDPRRCKSVRKRPSEYIKQLYFDSLVYTTEGLRHLITEVGARQVVIGTDFSFEMGNPSAVDHILGVPGLSDAEREAVLGGNAARSLGIHL